MVNATNVSGIVGSASSFFTNIGVAIIYLLGGFVLGLLVQRILYKIFREIELNKIMRKVGVTYNLEKWVSNVISYVFYLGAVVMFLDQLGIKSIVLYLIVGGVLMLIILTFLVGLKDVIPNFVAWLFIHGKGKVEEGKRIDIKEISGRVEKVGFLETEIKTDNDDILYVPNSLFLKSKFWVRKKKH